MGFTYQGLKALGVPQASLDSFSPEFQQGMAARAAELGDVGESGPEQWEQPLGSPAVHVALSVLSPDAERSEALADQVRRARHELPGIDVIWRQDCYQLPNGRTSFGFKDGIGQPAVEGSGIPSTNPQEKPLKAGEFILGYPDETGSLPPMPTPEVLGRNGTYIVFVKLHTRVAAYRRYLRENSANKEEEAALGAKGRALDIFGSPTKRGRSMNLVRFLAVVQAAGAAQKTRGARGTKKQLAALAGQIGFAIKRGGGLKTIPGAFLGNHGRTVFQRTGKGRLPIKPVQVIGVSQMFSERGIRRRVMEKINADLVVEMKRAVDLILSRRA